METRAVSSIKAEEKINLQYSKLPEDILFASFEFLNPIDLLVITRVSVQFKILAEEPYFWNQYAHQNFLIENKRDEPDEKPSEFDSLMIKPQCVSFELNLLAEKALRSDRKRHYYSQAFHFLAPYKEQEWAQYYLGATHYHGSHLPKDQKKGTKLFLKSHEKDYRSAQFFARGLRITNRKKQSEFKRLLAPTATTTILVTLQNAAKRDHKIAENVSYDIAELFLNNATEIEKRIRITPVPLRPALVNEIREQKQLARPWLERTSKTHLIAAEHLVNIDLTLEQRKNKKRVIQYFEDLYIKFPSGLLAYKIGMLWRNYIVDKVLQKEEKKSPETKEEKPLDPKSLENIAQENTLKWLMIAFDQSNPQAAEQLAILYMSGWNNLKKDLEKAREFYLKAFSFGHTEALRNLADLIRSGEIPGTLEESLNYYKKAFHAGDVRAAVTLSEIYRKGSWENKPSLVWWVQIAAQCDCQVSLNALKQAAKNAFPYVHCALTFFYSFANCEQLLFSHRAYLSQFVFGSKVRFDRDALAQYREAGLKEGLVERRMEVAFEKWEKELVPKIDRASSSHSLKR